ncbi:MAG TPA: carboxymuconolactone decarboxylase family protein [Candidatus Acidoferrum sp.]|nr:carboxymuconolactone decarboxylase family protein [Candidatus Acidoferrum sp.]
MARLASIASVPRPPDGQPPAQGPALPDCAFLHLLANSAAATKAYFACQSALAGGLLTPRQREMLALAVAEINGSKYCLAAHGALARKAGLSAQDIRLARKAAAADPQEDAMLRFAQAVTLQRGDVSDADFQTLKGARFTDAQVAEIVAHIALNILTNYFNVLARTELDFAPLKPD